MEAKAQKVMTNKKVFPYSLVPLALSASVVALMTYVATSPMPEYYVQAWSLLFTDLMPFYIGIIAIAAFGNCVFVLTASKKEYDRASTLFINISSFLVALLVYISWYAF